jgi:uncharacterized membrane protein (DUF106 family)
MSIINTIFNAIFNTLFAPFRGMNPWVAMLVVSLLTGIFMIFIYKLTSNQAGIAKTKNLIKAHLLELRLYKDSMSTSFRSYGSILWCNLKYIGHALRPMLVMIIPMVLILIQLNAWFGYRSLREGEPFLLKVKLAEGRDPMQTNLEVAPSPAYDVETPALRMQEEREIDWRLKPKQSGLHEIAFTLDGSKVVKTLAVKQKPLSRISPLKPGRRFFDLAFNPSEPALAKDTPIQSIEVAYPEARLVFLGIRFHWLVAFFLLSIVFGFGLKGVFKVEI